MVGMHLTQIQRYEKGDTQPTLEVIHKLVIAPAISADTLIFDPDERGPGDDLKLHNSRRCGSCRQKTSRPSRPCSRA